MGYSPFRYIPSLVLALADIGVGYLAIRILLSGGGFQAVALTLMGFVVMTLGVIFSLPDVEDWLLEYVDLEMLVYWGLVSLFLIIASYQISSGMDAAGLFQ